MLAIQDHLIALVQDFTGFYHATEIFPLRVILFLLDGDPGPQRVTDKNRFREAQFVIPVCERHSIDLACGQSDPDGEGHRAVRDPLAELRLPSKLGIDVMWEIVAG